MPRDQGFTKAKGRAHRWLRLLDAQGVQYLILDKVRDRKLLGHVRSQTGWAVDFEDAENVLFVRAGASNLAQAAVK